MMRVQPFVPLLAVAALTYMFPVMTSVWIIVFWAMLLRDKAK